MILFGLDGTLWDSGANVADSWNVVLRQEIPEFGTVTADFVHSIMGKTMDEIAKISLPDVADTKRTDIFRKCEIFEVEYIEKHGGVLFDGVRETLEELKAGGHRLAVVSNCQSGYIEAFLKSMDMSGYFCDIEQWGNTKLPKAGNIRLVMERNHETKGIYVGDTQKDLDAARGAGIPFIHAAYGFGTADHPDMIIHDFSELPALVEEY